MKRKTKNKLAGILATILVAGVTGAFIIYRTLTASVTSGKDFNLYLYPGTTQDQIVSMIVKADSSAHVRGLAWWLKYMDYDDNPKSGCYTVRSKASAHSVAGILKGGMQTPVNISIRSVRKTGQMARDLSRQLMADSASIACQLSDTALIDSLGYTPATVFCMVVPNTYQVYWNIAPRALVERLARESSAFWNESRQAKAASIGLDRTQVFTLASIIEEETAQADELAMVAGLYMNRLHKGMMLQADPTVIYALSTIGIGRPRRVTRDHLKVDSPYNTYKVTGLPPAPIRFVNPRSVDAVLDYTRHNYIYMCAKEDFSGHHNFATSYARHMENARRYQRALNQRDIK